MNDDAVTALRQWIADRETYSLPRLGDAVVTSTPEGIVINRADERIGVALELAQDSNDGLGFAVENDDHGKPIGVLTLQGVNRAVRYRVVGYALPHETLICERIDAADAVD